MSKEMEVETDDSGRADTRTSEVHLDGLLHDMPLKPPKIAPPSRRSPALAIPDALANAP